MLFLYWGTVLFQATLGGVYLRRWFKFSRRADLFISVLEFLSVIFLLVLGVAGGLKGLSASR